MQHQLGARAACERESVCWCHSGAMRSNRTTVRNCAPENLEILRCAIAHRSSLVTLAPRNDAFAMDYFAGTRNHGLSHSSIGRREPS
jgi:hypothetical protein